MKKLTLRLLLLFVVATFMASAYALPVANAAGGIVSSNKPNFSSLLSKMSNCLKNKG